MVFLVSPESVQSGCYARTELKYAQKKWPHPERRVLPVLVKPTPYETIPVYLRAVTILRPEGNVPAEVVAALDEWGDRPSTGERFPPSSRTRELLIVIAIALGLVLVLGTTFSVVYPRVEVDTSLGLGVLAHRSIDNSRCTQSFSMEGAMTAARDARATFAGALVVSLVCACIVGPNAGARGRIG